MERIISARKRAGLTQAQLAAAIGVKRAVISKYETGAIEPSISQLQKIAAALKVPLSSLLTDIDDTFSFNSESLEMAINEHLHSPKKKRDETAHRKILGQSDVDNLIATAEQEHMSYLEKLCFDQTTPDEDYPARIRYITSFVEKNADTLRLAMPGTSMAPDDIEEAKKIRAAGGTPDSSK